MIDEEKDITYKILLENYARSSAKYAKKMDVETSKELANSINALSNYRNQIRHNNLLVMMKELNFTSDDLVKMFEERIISNETLSKMIKYKFRREE